MNLINRIIKLLSMLDRDMFPESYEYLESVVEGSNEHTQYQMASTLVECDKPKVFPFYMVQFIVELYEAEINEGNHYAMNDLGARYYCGDRGFEQNFEKAVYYYNMAAQRGNRQAQENLGYCYYYGRDMDVDYEKAFRYFALGAFDGHLISLYKIGDMYLNGYYVEKNETEAFLIYNRCLSTMTDEAAKSVAGPVHLRLGNMFLQGIGTDKDAERALAHYHAAEYFLFKMVKDGDYMYKKSLLAAIEGQEKARKLLTEQLPEDEWTFDD